MRGIVLAGGTGSRLHPITVGSRKKLFMVCAEICDPVLTCMADVCPSGAPYRLIFLPVPLGVCGCWRVIFAPEGVRDEMVVDIKPSSELLRDRID